VQDGSSVQVTSDQPNFKTILDTYRLTGAQDTPPEELGVDHLRLFEQVFLPLKRLQATLLHHNLIFVSATRNSQPFILNRETRRGAT